MTQQPKPVIFSCKQAQNHPIHNPQDPRITDTHNKNPSQTYRLKLEKHNAVKQADIGAPFWCALAGLRLSVTLLTTELLECVPS